MFLTAKTQKLMQELEEEKAHLQWNAAEMSVELKRLLQNEIESLKQRDKHRSALVSALRLVWIWPFKSAEKEGVDHVSDR